jgi:hypothetical protein
MGDLVTEDLAEPVEAPAPRRSRGGAPGLVLGIGIGLAGGLLFGVFDRASPEDVLDSPDPIPAGELLPGFEAGLSVAAGGDNQSLEFVEWPPAVSGRPLERSPLPFGDLGVTVLPTFDISGHFVAVGVPLRATGGSSLYAGPVGAIGAVGHPVTGHAWHDSVPALLGFSTEVDGEVGIWWIDGNVRSEHNATSVEGLAGARMVALGDWGYALQHGEEVVVVDGGGEILRTHRGQFQDSLPEGWLLLRRDGQPIRVAPDGVEESIQLGAEVDDVLAVLDTVGDWWASAFAGRPDAIALLGRRGLAIIESGVISLVDTDSQRPFLAVGSGYLAYIRQGGGIVMVDLGSGADFEVLVDMSVRAVAIRSTPSLTS